MFLSFYLKKKLQFQNKNSSENQVFSKFWCCKKFSNQLESCQKCLKFGTNFKKLSKLNVSCNLTNNVSNQMQIFFCKIKDSRVI